MGGPWRFVRRLASLARSSSEDASLNREIASHLQLLEDELAIVGVLLVSLSSIASYLPARRAIRLDPVAALRQR